MIDDIARRSLLYDFYGQLLTQRQQQIMDMYVQENLSLAEISEELDISRQAVHDALRTGQKSLEDYENKLGLMGRYLETTDIIEEIDKNLLGLMEQTEDPDIRTGLKSIKTIIDRLEE